MLVYQFVSACWTDLMALDLLPDFFAYRFYTVVLPLSDFSYPSRKQSKLARYLDNFLVLIRFLIMLHHQTTEAKRGDSK